MKKMTVYHGTIDIYAKEIVKQSVFKESNKNNEWLGKGVYFFAMKGDAQWWAELQVAKANRTDILIGALPAIISTELQCLNENFFDLDERSNLATFDAFFANWLYAIKRLKKGAPEFKSEYELACFASNLYKKCHPNITVLAYTYNTSEKTSSGFKFKQRQLCVSKQSDLTHIIIYNGGVES